MKKINLGSTCMVLAFSVILLGTFTGCSLFHHEPSGIREGESALLTGNKKAKKILVAPIVNASGISTPDLNRVLKQPIARFLDAGCAHAVVADNPDLEKEVENQLSGPTGLSESAGIMEMAQKSGINAIVTGSLWDISTDTEKRGIYGFRDEYSVITAGIHIWVYDTFTGVKILDRTIECKQDASVASDLKVSRDKVPDACPANLLDQAAEMIQEELCRVIDKDLIWRAFVANVTDGNVKILAGKATGLAVGDKLTVYGPGEVVQGVGQEQFVIPGAVLGKVRVVDVSEQWAMAEVISGIADAGVWVSLDDQ